MSKFQKSLMLWCVTTIVCSIVVYAIIANSLVRIGRVESAEMLRAAALAEEQEQPLDAIAEYLSASQFVSDPTPVYLSLARLERRTGRMDDALEHARLAVTLADSTTRVESLLALARVCSELALWEEAHRAYSAVIDADETLAEGYHGLAWASWALHDFAAMAQAFDRAGGLPSRGSSREFFEDREKAEIRLRATQQRIAQDGENGATLYRLAMIRRDLDEWGECVELLTQAIAFPDVPPDAWYWLGIAAEARGDSAQATEHYQKVAGLLPEHERAQSRLSALRKSISGDHELP